MRRQKEDYHMKTYAAELAEALQMFSDKHAPAYRQDGPGQYKAEMTISV